MSINTPPETNLTAEEKFLWSCARHYRRQEKLTLPEDLNWDITIRLALENRMQTLLEELLNVSDRLEHLPEEAAHSLRKGVRKYKRQANMLQPALRRYLEAAAKAGQEVVVLKGLWLSERIYGQASMRPGADIDVLLRESAIPQSMTILEQEMGYGTWWRPLLADQYYQRHHLHQQRCNHDRSIWIEPHWRLDHPYTQLTVDYEAMMNRTEPADLWGLPVREMSPPDLLLTLSIHLVKHAVYLPAVLHRPDLARLILADGMLVYFLDVAEAIRYYEATLSWPAVVELAKESGAVDILGSVLWVCHHYLATDIPDQVLNQLSVAGPGGLTRLAMNGLADHEIARYQGREPGKLWSFLLGYQASIVFRPIRLLDFVHYLFPQKDYLRRRYGRASIGTRLRHLVIAATQYVRIGWDTFYFTLKRRLEVRALDRQGYIWPSLPQFDD